MYNSNTRSVGSHQSGGFKHFSSQGFSNSNRSPKRPNRWAHSTSNNSGNSRPTTSRRGRFSQHIDTAMFIKKAQEFIPIEESKPVHCFEDFNLNPVLLTNIKAKGYVKPTPIQDKAIDEILSGRDVLGIANTGTGKTAAFAIPLLQKILDNPSKKILILAPTRELAQQIKQDIRSFTPELRVYIALAIGGAFLREQIMDIKRGPHIIIGTPGRIMDLNRRRVFSFSSFDTVVLDEVDRMLDMGFIADIKAIMTQIPQSRQTLFFSATVDKKIDMLINGFLHNPVKISVKTQEASTHVDQNIVRVERSRKQDMLYSLVSKEEFTKVLVFGATKRTVESVSIFLSQKGLRVDSLHGDKRQRQRQMAIKAFKENQIKVLVATDVAARGLDIADISHVINFDQPNNYEDYIHRIGRTGRGNAKGCALTFVE